MAENNECKMTQDTYDFQKCNNCPSKGECFSTVTDENIKLWVDIIKNMTPGVSACRINETFDLITANDSYFNTFDTTYKYIEEHNLPLILGFCAVDRDTLITHVKKCISEGKKSFQSEIPCTTLSGRKIVVMATHSVYNDVLISSINDETDRIATERKMSLQGKEYIAVARLSGKQILHYDIESHKLVEYSAGSIDFEPFMENGVIENFPESIINKKIVADETVKSFKEMFDNMRKGAPYGGARVKLIYPDKTERWFLMVFAVVYDNEKKPSSAVFLNEDITEQIKKEIALARIKKQYEQLDEKKYIAYDINLTHLRIESVSGYAIDPNQTKVGYPKSVLDNYIANEILLPKYASEFKTFVSPKRLLRLYSNNVSYDSMIAQAYNNKNELVWFSLTVQMISDPVTNDLRGYFIAQDINDVKAHEYQLEQELKKTRAELKNSRIKVMMNQMQPHFLYNALSSIRAITLSNPQYASDLIYDFTLYLRSSIKALSNDEPICFDNELDSIKAYLNIEYMRFGEKLNVVYQTDYTDFNVIPLSIQPFVENAVKHGIYERGKLGGTVTIKSYRKDNKVIIEINDDGVGFDVDAVMQRQGNSVGMKNSIFRLQSLMGAKVDIKSKIGIGTKVKISFVDSLG